MFAFRVDVTYRRFLGLRQRRTWSEFIEYRFRMSISLRLKPSPAVEDVSQKETSL